MNGVAVSHDGKLVRLDLDTTEGEIGIFVLAKNLPALIPALIKAEAQARERAGPPRTSTVFDVSKVRADPAADKRRVVISLTLPPRA